MNRKQFLQALAVCGLLTTVSVGLKATRVSDAGAQEKTAEQSMTNNAKPFTARRATTTFTGHLSFPPGLVFPLLCPFREYDWLDGWQSEMIYSNSGAAEDNCVFKTKHAGGMSWTVSQYEPPKRIEFTTFAQDGVITRLNLTLTASQGGTDLQWTRVFTSLNGSGSQSVGTWNTERDADLTNRLEHYLKTGEMLRLEDAPSKLTTLQ